MRTKKKLSLWVLIGIVLSFMVFASGICSAASYPQTTTAPLDTDLSMNQRKITDVGDIVTKGPWLDVRAFGAKGDGITDDTAKIQAAFNNGGIVFFPSGTYLHSGLTLVSDLSIIGSGRGKSILRYTGSGVGLQAKGRLDRVVIRDIKFDATGTPSGPAIKNTFITGDLNMERFSIAGFKVGIDLYQTINCYIGQSRIDGQGYGVAGGIGIKLGDIATSSVSTTTTLDSTYISHFETGIRNDYCVDLVLLRPVIEFYNTAIYSRNKTVVIGGYSEAGRGDSPVSVKSEDAFTDILPFWESGYNLISGGPGWLGRERFNRIGWGSEILGGGISSSAGFQNPVASSNLRGSINISGSNTSGTVIFNSPEPNTNYFLSVTPTAIVGTPASGSKKIASVTKTTKGFTLNVEAVPGIDKSVTFDWLLIH